MLSFVSSPKRTFAQVIFSPGRRTRDFIDRVAEASPARLAIFSFLAVVALFTVLLLLPIAHQNPNDISFARSLTVTVSAVCVTGLTPVDFQDYWTGFGLVTIVVAVQLGGLGILTLASVLGMVVSKGLGVRQRLIAMQATNAGSLGQVGSLLRAVVIAALTVESVIFAMLFPRFLMRGEEVGTAVWYSIFYSVSSFNNAGFAIHPGGIAYYADDPWILFTLMLSVFVGSLGFPVILVATILWNKPRSWDLHTKLTLTTSAILVAVGFFLFFGLEFNNPDTLGNKGFGATFWETLFMSVMTRSGGFNTIDMALLSPASHLVTDILMFIGGGSSSTAGGVKVTTLAVLVMAAWAEARGYDDVTSFGRRIGHNVVRVAISVVFAGLALVLVGTIALLQVTHESLDRVLFEVISAFGTVGLSMGITSTAPDSGLYILSSLMLLGRLGTITLAAAVSSRSTKRLFRYPEERPIIG